MQRTTAAMNCPLRCRCRHSTAASKSASSATLSPTVASRHVTGCAGCLRLSIHRINLSHTPLRSLAAFLSSLPLSLPTHGSPTSTPIETLAGRTPSRHSFALPFPSLLLPSSPSLPFSSMADARAWWFTFGLPLLLSLAGYLVYQHSTNPFPAIPYTLQPPPPLTVNTLLHAAELHHSPLLSAPETIAVHPADESLWTGCYDGSIVRADVSAERPFEARLVSYSGWAAAGARGGDGGTDVNVSAVCSDSATRSPWLCGRPLGLLFRNADQLIVADAYHGLLSYSLATDRWAPLWNDSQRDTNSVALDSSGDVLYFTSASARYRNHVVLYDSLSGQCSGSVWQYSFRSHTARLISDGRCFPNGILVSGRQLIVAETNAARILAFDIHSGEQQQQQQQRPSVVTDSDCLPCLPDNLHWDRHSSEYYWAGCGGPIRAADSFSLIDFAGRLPLLRQLIVYILPHSLIGALVRPEAMVMRMRIVNQSYHAVSDVLMDPHGERLRTTTSAVWRAKDDKLWFTSFKPVSNIEPVFPNHSSADRKQHTRDHTPVSSQHRQAHLSSLRLFFVAVDDYYSL